MEQDIPAIVAETAVMYFKLRFRTKEWDGTPWPPTKRPVKRGSLMVRTGKLVNSIRPKKVTKTEVVISAGSYKVPYAQVHNEGFTGVVNVHSYVRKMQGKTVMVKSHNRRVHIPRRQFMGSSPRLNEAIENRIQKHISTLFKS